MVDVIIQVYGKPWQTICTIESLMIHSKKWIDKIYLLEEAKHPFGDNIDLVFGHSYPIIHKKLEKFVNIYGTKSKDVPVENVRHQWGIEQSNKKYVFIMHNDVLFTEDIIGNMLQDVEGYVGVGQIGQCWNCPLNHIGKCSGERFYDVNITLDDINSLKLPYIRTRRDNLDKEVPRLMPECRLNEFACLIDREACIREGRPYFGEFDEDSGTEWFKAMYKKGYKFKDYRKDFIHAYWNSGVGGHESEQKERMYWEAEENAKRYFKEHFEC